MYLREPVTLTERILDAIASVRTQQVSFEQLNEDLNVSYEDLRREINDLVDRRLADQRFEIITPTDKTHAYLEEIGLYAGKPLVIVHGGGCFDGFCSAWVLRKLVSNAEFFFAQYGGKEPPDATNRPVWVADITLPLDTMKRLLQQSAKLVVIDHHKTAEEPIKQLSAFAEDNGINRKLKVIFRLNKSGAGLCWEYLSTRTIEEDLPLSVTEPWLVSYVQDRDLWEWKLPFSKEINSFLRSLPMDFHLWDRMERDIANPTRSSRAEGNDSEYSPLAEGTAILRAEKQIVGNHLKFAKELMIGGYVVLGVNATVLFSEIAGELAKGRPFGVAWFRRQDGMYQYSLRSEENGIDVSEVAACYGGGGHCHAAGFQSGVLIGE